MLTAQARAVVNFRILPGESIDTVLEHVRRTVADPRVQVRVLPGAREASPVSDVGTFGYRAIEQSLRAVFPEALVAPGLMVARPDAAHFEALSEDCYRFIPYRLAAADVDRIHGLNERMSVEGLGWIVQFYVALIRNSAAKQTA